MTVLHHISFVTFILCYCIPYSNIIHEFLTHRPQMVFLADDHEAASRIPELLTTLSERAGSFEDSQLFPNTRSGPLSAATTTERDLRTTIDTIRTLSRTDESSIDVGSESRLESKMGGSRSNPEVKIYVPILLISYSHVHTHTQTYLRT